MGRDRAKTSLSGFEQRNSIFSHGNFTILYGLLEHYNLSTLRDRVEKPISHLGGLEVENIAVRTREKVPRRISTLGRMPHSPLSSLVTREEDWKEEAPVTVEKERD
jgi:hypothetical protein